MLYQILIYPIELIIEIIFYLANQILNNPGLSIIAVSFGVNFLTLPMYSIAEKLQQKERDVQKKMEPQIKRIKSVFQGDEQYMILSTYYRQNHYHPLFALRSSVSLLIQVPFFIAAYHFLSNLEVLDNANFLFINNLGSPDGLLRIGRFSINILPIIMTLINLIASIIYTKGFPTKEKIQLYVMAFLFLILLYNSPAGLVIYWTLNNIFSLVKNIFYKFKNPIKILYFSATIACALLIVASFVFDLNSSEKLLIILLSIIIFSSPLIIKFLNFFSNSILKNLTLHPKTRFSLFFVSCLCLFLLSGVLLPTNLISSSPAEFSFISPFSSPLELVKFPLFQSFGLFVFWFCAIYFLFSDKTKNILTFLTATLVFFFIINAFVLPGEHGVLSETFVFSNEIKGFPQIKDVIIAFLVLTVITCLLFAIIKFNKTTIISSFYTIILLSMTVVSIFNVITIKKEFNKIAAHHTELESNELKPIFNFTKTGENVFIMFIDGAIGALVEEIFNESPSTANQYEGFTYYPNTVSFNCHTLIASPPMYGGYEYTPIEMNKRSNEKLVDKHNEALNVLPTFFLQNDYECFVTDVPWVNYSWYVDINIFDDKVRTDKLRRKYSTQWKSKNNFSSKSLGDFMSRNLFFVSLFNILPECTRGIIYDDASWLSSDKSTMDSFIGNYSLIDFLPELTNTSSNKNQFIFIESDICHDGTEILQYPDYVPQKTIDNPGTSVYSNESRYHALAATLHRIGEWLDYLKEQGVYDNTRIILVADHGLDLEHNQLEKTTHNPLFMIKDFDSREPVKKDLSFMTNADMPYYATLNIVDNPTNPMTGNKFSIEAKNDGVIVSQSHDMNPEHHTSINPNQFNLENTLYFVENTYSNWSKQ